MRSVLSFTVLALPLALAVPAPQANNVRTDIQFR